MPITGNIIETAKLLNFASGKTASCLTTNMLDCVADEDIASVVEINTNIKIIDGNYLPDNHDDTKMAAGYRIDLEVRDSENIRYRITFYGKCQAVEKSEFSQASLYFSAQEHLNEAMRDFIRHLNCSAFRYFGIRFLHPFGVIGCKLTKVLNPSLDGYSVIAFNNVCCISFQH